MSRHPAHHPVEGKIYLYRRKNGVYYVGRCEGDRRRWKSTGCTRKCDALKKIRELEKMWTPPDSIHLSAFTREFLTHAGQTYAPKTVRLYSDALWRLGEFLGDVPLLSITARDVDRFKTERRRSIRPITVNKELSTLRAAMNTALRWGHIQENPFSGVKMLRVPERTAEFLTPEDLARLLSCILDDWLRDVVLFAVATGMRQGEILALRWLTVDLKARIVHIENSATFRTKTGRRRTVPLNALATGVLLSRRNEGLQPDAPVFTYNGRGILQDSLAHAFKRHVRKAGLGKEIRFHSLRHTHASLLARAGVSLYQIGVLLGHSDPKTTRIYSHLQPEQMHGVVEHIDVMTDASLAGKTGNSGTVAGLIPVQTSHNFLTLGIGEDR